MKTQWLAALALLGGLIVPAKAQDARNVAEPAIPAACTVLSAALTATDNALPEEAEHNRDTARIQQAIDACKAGEAVELKADGAHNAFLSGPLSLRSGVTLLIDRGVTLYASRDARLYDLKPGLCGTLNESGHGCKPLISVDHASNAAVMGDGAIDGQGDAKILGQNFTWWELALAAHQKNLRQNCPRLVVADHADGFVLYRITLHNSPNFHVVVSDTDGFTAWGVHIKTPFASKAEAPNTDGIDPGSSSNITIAHSWIDDGDDNIAIKTGITHMSVLGNHFYSGHGMSIGSETYTGDSNLLVDGLTEDGTANGIRVKSNDAKGGLVHDLTYRNICMRNVTMPIAISPFYNDTTIEGFTDPNIPGNRIPTFKAIRIENVHDLTRGTVLIAGKDADHVTQVTLDGVFIDGLQPSDMHSQFADIAIGPQGSNVTPDGKGVTVTQAKDAKLSEANCDGKFLPMQ